MIVASLGVIGIIIDASWYRSFDSSVLRWSAIACVALLVSALIPVTRQSETTQSATTQGETTQSATTRSGRTSWACTAVIVMSAFGLWHAWDQHRYHSASITRLTDRAHPIVVRGQIRRTVSLRPNPISFSRPEADVSPWQSQIVVEVDSARVGDRFQPFGGNLLVYVDGDFSARRPGDRLEVYGWIHPFEGPTNPGEADLRPAYRARRLHARLETKNAGRRDAAVRVQRSIWGRLWRRLRLADGNRYWITWMRLPVHSRWH